MATLLAAPLLGLAACHSGEKTNTTSIEKDGVKASVEVTDAWCRPTPNGATTGACYFTIKASTANRLTGAATPLAANAMVHDMTMTGGMANMSEMTGGLPLAAGEKIELKPGGRHLMLTSLTAPLADGTAVPLTLTFSGTPAMTLQAPVKQPK